MNIAYHSSNLFVPVLAVSMISLLSNNSDEKVNFFILEDNILEENKNQLMNMVEPFGATITFIPMPNINEKYQLGLKDVKNIWFFNSYCRLFLYDILPETIDRVLYLDSDTIINSNISEFYHSELNDKCLLAIPDCLSKSYYDALSVDTSFQYCNSGVLLEDLSKIRKMDFQTIIREFINKNNGYVFFMEQTVLSAALGDKILYGNLKFNIQTVHILFNYKQYLLYKKPINVISKEEFDNARSNPSIIHLTNFFAVKNRAWYDKTNHPLKELFVKYKMNTPWKDDYSAFKDNRSITTKIFDSLLLIIPNQIKAWFFGIIYNGPRVRKIKKTIERSRK